MDLKNLRHVFTMHEDPGHGWLEVPVHLSQCVGLDQHDYSGFSYMREDELQVILYLEEDLDTGMFIRAWRDFHDGESPILERKVHGDDCFVRQLSHTSGRDFIPPGG